MFISDKIVILLCKYYWLLSFDQEIAYHLTYLLDFKWKIKAKNVRKKYIYRILYSHMNINNIKKNIFAATFTNDIWYYLVKLNINVPIVDHWKCYLEKNPKKM